jgi:hypothetical protein
MVPPKPLTPPINKAKCRLPIPSFSVDKRAAAAVPVKEKIANVIRKRQTMSDSNRSQGSRIPMLCILQPCIDNLPDDRPKLRAVKSVKLSDHKEPEKRPKTLQRSKTMPSLKNNNNNNKPASNNIKRLPPPEIKTKTLPPKSSIFRKRVLPVGESRTARLTMGLSTNGRRQSYKERENNNEITSPTLGYHPTRKSPTSLPSSPTTPLTTKKRPMSFGGSLSNNKKQIPVPIPEKKKNSLKNNIKATLRVH